MTLNMRMLKLLSAAAVALVFLAFCPACATSSAHSQPHSRDHVHNQQQLPLQPSFDNDFFWQQRKIALDGTRTPLRLVQFDFPPLSSSSSSSPRSSSSVDNEDEDEKSEYDNLCDIAVGDVYDVSPNAQATTLYQLVENPTDQKKQRRRQDEGATFLFPPVARENHGLVGAHAREYHHQFSFSFKMKKRHAFSSSSSDDEGDSSSVHVGGSFLDPRLHVGEVRNEDGEFHHDPHHDDHGHHNHKHELFYVQHEESLNIRIPQDVEEVEIVCTMPRQHKQQQQQQQQQQKQQQQQQEGIEREADVVVVVRRSFNIPQLAKYAPKYTPHRLRPQSPLRRTAKEQATATTTGGTASEPSVFPLRIRGPPHKQFNIIFLSAGFTASMQKVYNDSVLRALDFLDPTNTDLVASNPDLRNMHNSVPLDRYFPFSNVYSVWQPSLEAGASRPKIGLTVKNNLECYHPETIERAVTCNRKLAMALASVTPANPNERPDQSVVVTIVSTPIYGGSASFSEGSYHVGYFYHGLDGANQDQYDLLKYASLIKHEVGHAYFSLMDEYDIGMTQSSAVYFPNCQAPAAGGGGPAPSASTTPKLQWQVWADVFKSPTQAAVYKAGISTTTYSVAQTAIPICGYSNYYKPNSNCMMQQLRDYAMCPVCRDYATRMMLSLSQMSFAWPRFPVEDATLILPESTILSVISMSTGATLHLPAYLSSSGDFSVSWEDHLGNAIASSSVRFTINPPGCAPCLRLESAYLSSVPKGTSLRITAKINDNSNFAYPDYKTLPKYKNLFYQNTSFKFKVVAGATLSSDAKIQPKLIAGSAFGFDASIEATNAYYTECLPQYSGHQPVCNLTFEQVPYKAPQGLNAELDAAEFYVFIILGACGLVFLLAWVLMASKFSKLEQGRVRPIFESSFGGAVDCIYRIMNVSAIGFMLMSIATLGAAGFMYSRISAIGKIVIFPGIALAIGLFIMAFTGFWSLKMRSVRLIVANGVVLYMGFTVLFAATAIVVNLGAEITDRKSFWNRNLRLFWDDMATTNPERACGFEGMLACSGFFISCTGVGSSSDSCPRSCAANSEYATPCQKRLQDWVVNNYTIIIAVCVACLALMAFALLFNFIFFYNLVKMKADIRRRLESQFESSHIGQYGRKSDPNAPDRALKFLQMLGERDSEKLVTEFRRIDNDGNGELDPNELRAFFKKAFCFRVSMQQIQYLFSVADRDGSGTISVPEFLALFDGGLKSARTYRPDDLEKSQRIDNVAMKVKSQTNFNRLAGGGVGVGDDGVEAEMEVMNRVPKVGGLLRVPAYHSPRSNEATPAQVNRPPVAASAAAAAAFPMMGMKGAAATAGKKPPGKASFSAVSSSPASSTQQQEQQQQQEQEPDLFDTLLEGDGHELTLL